MADDPQFSVAPLVPGSIRGTRSFRVTDDGQLTGVVYEIPWEPGENKAMHVPYSILFSGAGQTNAKMPPNWLAIAAATLLDAGEHITGNHKVASLKCHCGFYAYFTGADEYHREGTVSGIVEGYGRVVAGNKGFRCEKAKLVALVAPKSVSRRRWLSWLPRSFEEVVAAALPTVFLAATVACNVVGAPLVVDLILSVVTGALLRGTVLYIKARRRGEVGPATEVAADKWAKVAERYPDLPVYSSLREAVKAHPLSEPVYDTEGPR